MSEVSDRLRRLEIELEALQRIQTQEDFDEGARLHALHNAPWVKGAYTHIEFPPYKFEAFPMAIYKTGFLEANRELVEAEMIPAFGQADLERKQAVLLASRKLARLVKKVHSEGELRKWLLTREWFESPEAIAEEARSNQRAIETAAAHRAYEDRNMGPRARQEADAYDEAAEAFVGEVPEQRRGPTGRRVTSAAAIKAAKAAGGQHGEKGKGGAVAQGRGEGSGAAGKAASGRRGR